MYSTLSQPRAHLSKTAVPPAEQQRPQNPDHHARFNVLWAGAAQTLGTYLVQGGGNLPAAFGCQIFESLHIGIT